MKRILHIALAVSLLLMGGCNNQVDVKPPEIVDTKVEKEEHIKIITTSKLLYYMVRDIIEDKHSVDYMLKSTEEQWLFNYSEDSLENISKKDMFIYMGAGYEPWTTQFIEDLEKGKVAITNASRGVKLLSLTVPLKYGEEELKDNPYYWLNPEDYKIALANIKNSIQEKDPKNREIYEANFNECIKNIDKYIMDMKTLGEELKKYTFIVVGDNLDYLIKNLELKAVKLNEQDYPAVDLEKLNKKIEDAQNIVFLYEKRSDAEKYSDLIKHYQMLPVHLIAYEFDMKYFDILDYNIDALEILSVE